MHPPTGSRSRRPSREPTRVWRTVLVKGGNVLSLRVKVVREHVIYIVCEPRLNVPYGKKRTFGIKKGALLIRNTRDDAGGQEYFTIFNDGIYQALRSQGHHVPINIDREQEAILLMRSTVEWGVRQTWILNKGSPPEAIAEYEERIGGLADGLAAAVNEDKVVARQKATKGSTLRDSAGKINAPSRGMILWSASHRLDNRARCNWRIKPRIGIRHADLLSLADMAWVAKRDFETEVAQALTVWWAPGRTIKPRRAASMSDRFKLMARTMRQVSLAPFSRRGFPRSADDLDEAANALREGRYVYAGARLDACRRAFLMMDARRKIEEMCLTASLVRKAKVVPTAEEIDLLEADVDASIAMLHEHGQPLDRWFKNPVIEPGVLPKLRDAVNAARSPDGYQSKKVYEALKAAAIPL